MKKRTFIIAEAGVNHNGNLNLAKKLIKAAKASGADAVKFQTFVTEDMVTQSAPKAKYQQRMASADSQFTMLKKLELSFGQFRELSKFAKVSKIMFLSTPFDYKSLRFLDELKVKYFKISSGDLTNLPFLKEVAKYKRAIILSTGMSTLFEVRQALRAIYSTGNKKVMLLHCVSNYPAKHQDLNLNSISTLKRIFKLPVGYSDHSLGIEAAIAAVSLGAEVIEKHFTLNKGMDGPDHKASLEPDEFKVMVHSIRNIEKALGKGIKAPCKSEGEMRKVARKSLVAADDISKGQKIKEDMLLAKRPGIGIEPQYLNRVIGLAAKRSIKKDQVIKWKDFK